MRIRVQIIAEDHSRGMKATREEVIEIPDHRISESADFATQVRGTAEWALGHAAHAVQSALNPQQPSAPIAPVGAAAVPGQESAQPPMIQTGDHSRGTQAPLDQKRTPRTADEIIQQSMGGLQAAIQEDKNRSQPLVDPNGKPNMGMDHIGWGPHRRR